MICFSEYCHGDTGDSCPKHGPICLQCGMPSMVDSLCGRCAQLKKGTLCPCGSKWVYITDGPAGPWLCKPCVHRVAAERGWNESYDAIMAGLALERERLEERRANTAQHQEALNKMKQKSKMEKPDDQGKLI